MGDWVTEKERAKRSMVAVLFQVAVAISEGGLESILRLCDFVGILHDNLRAAKNRHNENCSKAVS